MSTRITLSGQTLGGSSTQGNHTLGIGNTAAQQAQARAQNPSAFNYRAGIPQNAAQIAQQRAQSGQTWTGTTTPNPTAQQLQMRTQNVQVYPVSQESNNTTNYEQLQGQVSQRFSSIRTNVGTSGAVPNRTATYQAQQGQQALRAQGQPTTRVNAAIEYLQTSNTNNNRSMNVQDSGLEYRHGSTSQERSIGNHYVSATGTNPDGSVNAANPSNKSTNQQTMSTSDTVQSTNKGEPATIELSNRGRHSVSPGADTALHQTQQGQQALRSQGQHGATAESVISHLQQSNTNNRSMNVQDSGLEYHHGSTSQGSSTGNHYVSATGTNSNGSLNIEYHSSKPSNQQTMSTSDIVQNLNEDKTTIVSTSSSSTSEIPTENIGGPGVVEMPDESVASVQ